MCTSVVEIAGLQGAGKGRQGWFSLSHAVVAYDHPQHAFLEEAVTIDFVNAQKEPGARVAVEMTLDSAKGLLAALTEVIDRASREEETRARYAGTAQPTVPDVAAPDAQAPGCDSVMPSQPGVGRPSARPITGAAGSLTRA